MTEEAQRSERLLKRFHERADIQQAFMQMQPQVDWDEQVLELDAQENITSITYFKDGIVLFSLNFERNLAGSITHIWRSKT